jgi:hypothetical protein
MNRTDKRQKTIFRVAEIRTRPPHPKLDGRTPPTLHPASPHSPNLKPTPLNRTLLYRVLHSEKPSKNIRVCKERGLFQYWGKTVKNALWWDELIGATFNQKSYRNQKLCPFKVNMGLTSEDTMTSDGQYWKFWWFPKAVVTFSKIWEFSKIFFLFLISKLEWTPELKEFYKSGRNVI